MIIVEGSRMVGKSYLLNNIEGYVTYKVPFVPYFNEFLKTENFIESNKNNSAYHFTTGNDVAILSMYRQGLLNSNILFDRGFLSNVVLAVQQDRITIEDGKKYLDWLIHEQYTEYVTIIYVTADNKKDNRNKDNWNILDQSKTNELYELYISYIENRVNIIRFNNEFNIEDKTNFENIINSI